MRHYTKDDMFPKYWWVDDDTCEAGVIKEFFPDVKIILDAFHLWRFNCRQPTPVAQW